jgi:hypothetical protein
VKSPGEAWLSGELQVVSSPAVFPLWSISRPHSPQAWWSKAPHFITGVFCEEYVHKCHLYHYKLVQMNKAGPEGQGGTRGEWVWTWDVEQGTDTRVGGLTRVW